MRIGIIVTSRNDIRVLRTLESLRRQSRPPERVAVADGSDDDWLDGSDLPEKCQEMGATWLHAPKASVPQARNMGLEALKELEVVAFLDTDEVAPDAWLERLTDPIQEDEADFSGGPTQAWGRRTPYADYLQTIEDRHYRLVEEDISNLPMGNSAWRREIFDAIGGFDESFTSAGEDYDVNLRALDHGYRGQFVPEAWVYHDQSHLDTAWKILKRKYRYMIGGAMAYRKNQALIRKVGRTIRQPKYWHWLELFNPPLRLLALVRARRRNLKEGQNSTSTPG